MSGFSTYIMYYMKKKGGVYGLILWGLVYKVNNVICNMMNLYGQVVRGCRRWLIYHPDYLADQGVSPLLSPLDLLLSLIELAFVPLDGCSKVIFRLDECCPSALVRLVSKKYPRN